MGILSTIVDPMASYYEGKARLRGAKQGAKVMGKAYDESDLMAGQEYDQQRGIFDPYQKYGAIGRTALEGMLTGAGADQFNTPDYRYTKNIDQFLDPSMKFRLQQGIQGRDASAASRGNLFDSGYQKDLENYSQGLASTEYGSAFDRMANDRQSSLQEYVTPLEQARANRAQRMAGLEGMVQSGQFGDQGVSTSLQNMMANRQQNLSGRANMNAELSALKEQGKGSFGLALGRSLAGLGDAGLSYASGAGGLSSLFGGGQQPQQFAKWGRGGQLGSNGQENFNTFRGSF